MTIETTYSQAREQLNLLIPANAQTGSSIAVRIFQNSIPSVDSGATSTTIAIK